MPNIPSVFYVVCVIESVFFDFCPFTGLYTANAFNSVRHYLDCTKTIGFLKESYSHWRASKLILLIVLFERYAFWIILKTKVQQYLLDHEVEF